MLGSALAFYKLPGRNWRMRVFWLTPYDPCVEYKDINGNHMTVTLPINYLKVSHVKESGLEKSGDFLKADFEKNDLKVTHHRGPIHNYLGIGLDYSGKVKFKVSMIMYL